jgi:DNA repair exonuclease SbcCD nuclease subunit
MNSIRLIAAADLHLGRRLSNLPEDLKEFSQAPKMAWKHLVDYVSDEKNSIDALLLAGDLFDREEDLYEAVGYFEQGVRRILALGIPVIAIAGNHDAAVLGRCKRRLGLEQFYLLGETGAWESLLLDFHGHKIRFVGWSFTSAHCLENPLKRFPFSPFQEITIGLLHCEVGGGRESRYAPVELRDFRGLSPQAWVLGHTHVPTILSKAPLLFYCGSLQGLDPTETGRRGASLLEISPNGDLEHSFLPFAPVYWEETSFFPSSSDSLDADLAAHLQQQFEELPASTRALVCRLVFQGRTRCYGELGHFIERVRGHHFVQAGNIPCYLQQMSNECQPDFDIKEVSKGTDLAALLAKTLLASGEERKKILEEAALFVKMRHTKNRFSEVSLDQISSFLMRAGYELLDQILKTQDIPNIFQKLEFQHSRCPKFEPSEADPVKHKVDPDGLKVRDVGAAEKQFLKGVRYKGPYASY